jgi:hypothetical protein
VHLVGFLFIVELVLVLRWGKHVARMGIGDVYTVFCWGNLRERGHLGDPGVDGDNIEMEHEEVGDGVMDWIELAQDSDRWRALVNAVTNLRDP